MELRHLRYFVAVARERSFTRAAEILHIAQPPLSRQIQQLEEELGIALLERGTRPTHLTEQGRMLYEQAVQILERIDEMRAMVRRIERAKRDLFSVGFVASTLYGRLPEVIRAYRAARPDTELNLVELTSLEQIAALKEGRIDVGFGRIPFDDPAITRLLLRNERLVVALPLNHALMAKPGSLGVSDLAGERLIVYPKAPRPSYADQVLALFRDRGLKPAALHEVRELQTALGLVVAEAGICLVPASVEQLRRDYVAYRPLDDEAAVSPIFMSCRKDDTSPETGLVLNLIRGVYDKDGIAFGV
jgi:LysR family transcriptional regulator, benzoate and cis,cis-muconate-responsive activator of ben and cat genes